MAILNHRIKERREALGLSQAELAKRLGYSDRSTIAKIESGINDITQSKIEAFARVLQTTPAYLMGWDEMYNGDVERANATYHYVHYTMQEEASRRKEMIDNAPEGLSYKVPRCTFGVRVTFNCQSTIIQEIIGGICGAILAIQKPYDVPGLNALEALAHALPKLNENGLIRLSEYVKMLSSQDDYTKEGIQ